jgi:hypothetical protein
MNSKSRDLLLVWIVILFANRATFGQLTRGPRTISPVADALGAPTITIFTAATGTLIRSLGPNNASLDLGRVSYFQGVLVPGQTVRKSFGSIMISTRFNLRVDCPGSPSFSRVNVTISRRDEDGSYAVSVDGTTLGSAAQTLVQSMPCGSGSEHRLDVSVLTSSPAGPIDSTLALAATVNR